MRRYVCDRKIPRTDEVVEFEVKAEAPHIAAAIAEELAYATAWVRGLYSGKERAQRLKPDEWALRAVTGPVLHEAMRPAA